MVFHAPVRERGPRKSLYVNVFIELFALKLLIAVMARHAFFDSTYPVYQYTICRAFCLYALHTLVQKARDIK